MSKPLEYSDKLRGDFRRYLLKIARNKNDQSLTETEILKAFDLAVQKQKLTSLEAELVLPKQGIISKFDVSGDYDLTVSVEEDGVWVHFTAAPLSASLNMDVEAERRGTGIVANALKGWCANRRIQMKP